MFQLFWKPLGNVVDKMGLNKKILDSQSFQDLLGELVKVLLCVLGLPKVNSYLSPSFFPFINCFINAQHLKRTLLNSYQPAHLISRSRKYPLLRLFIALTLGTYLRRGFIYACSTIKLYQLHQACHKRYSGIPEVYLLGIFKNFL